MAKIINLTLSENTIQGLSVSFYAGEDVILRCQLSPVVNITGWSIKFTARAQLNILPILITKIVGGGITITDAANAKFDIQLDNADTNTATPQDYFFDVQRTNAGFANELGIGTLHLLQPVANM
jgi:hypothetical protein